MGVLSKYFHDAMRLTTCRDVVHPHTDNCIRAAAEYSFKPIWSTMQFFIPLFIISVAAKKDEFNWTVFWEMLKNFVAAVAAGLLTGSLGTFFICGLYNFFNKFRYYFIAAIPGFLGALSIFAAPNKIAVMFAHSTLVLVIEIMLKRRGNFVLSHLDKLYWSRTVLFMVLSAVILDSLRKVRPQISWFIQPMRYKSKRRHECYNDSPVFDSIVPVDENVCSHKQSCDAFIFNELKTYCKIGLAIEFVRGLLKNFGAVQMNPMNGIYLIFRRFNMRFLLFAIGYPSSYRIFNCILNRLYGFETKFANRTAAFASGIFFLAYPDLPFLSHAIACSIEIIWQRYQKCKRSKNSIFRQIHKLPLSKIFFPIFIGLLFHMRTFYPWQTPTLVMKAMNLVSAGHTDEMILNIFSFLMPVSAA